MIALIIFLLKLTISILLVLIGFLVGLLFPLAKKRKYMVLGTNEKVKISGEKISVIEIIQAYKPIILQKTNLRGPKPTQMYYEVIDDNKDEQYLDLIYRVSWPDEVHPNFIVNIIYKIFRIFYFRSKKDMEIILLRIDKSSREIIEIKYESDSLNDPEVFKSDHVLVVYKKSNRGDSNNSDQLENSGKRFIQYKNGKRIRETEIFIQNSLKGEKQVILPVLTWNHVFNSNIGKKTIEQEKEEYEEFNLPVFPLTDKIFKKYRFDRRSWIEYGCSINKKLPLFIGIIFGITIGFLCNSLLLF